MRLSGQLRGLQGYGSGSNRDQLGLSRIASAVRQRAPAPFHSLERHGWRDQKALRRTYGFRATWARDVHHRWTGHCPSHLFLTIHLRETRYSSPPNTAIVAERAI